MPLKSIRLLVALLLALVVPLQGIAAATAGVCMAMGHHEAATAADDAQAHGHSHEAQGEDAAAGSGMGHSSTPAAPSSDGHCGPCVACCAAAAISSFSQSLLPQFEYGYAMAAIPASFSGVSPETLDRPPLAL